MGKPAGRSVDVVYRRRTTSELTDGDFVAIRVLLHAAFGDDFTEDDWDHALGGVHVTAHRGPDLVGHGSVVPRRFFRHERFLRTGYVEAVAVHPDHRGAGIGRGLMEVVGDLVDRYYDLGALSARGPGLAFYKHLGWERWPGPTQAIGPGGLIPTPEEDGGIFVRRVDPTIPLDGPLGCDWRTGDLW